MGCKQRRNSYSNMSSRNLLLECQVTETTYQALHAMSRSAQRSIGELVGDMVIERLPGHKVVDPGRQPVPARVR